MSHSIERDRDQCGGHPFYDRLHCTPLSRVPVSSFTSWNCRSSRRTES